MVFRTGPLQVSTETAKMAQSLLYPDSPVAMKLDDGCSQLFTVQGRIVSLSAIRQVQTKDGAVPIRDLRICTTEGTEIPICLWREEALGDFAINASISISHLRLSKSPSFGTKASSTQFTETKEISIGPKTTTITINGIATGQEVVFSTCTGGELKASQEILAALAPAEGLEIFDVLPLTVTVVVKGDSIIEVVN
ncbi:hypothetical protein OJAV_G00233280 [Oryzias javanicus]|nr:hypothetical protein OJAV_G00233280 [Oryzias javanicus]